MLAHHGIDKRFPIESVERWYGGYTTSNGDALFNPYSVATLIRKRTLGAHWSESGRVSHCVGVQCERPQ